MTSSFTHYPSLLAALEAAPPERRFMTMWHSDDDAQHVTFGEFMSRARAAAACLIEEGLGREDTIVLIMPQGIELMTTFVAAMLAGAVPAILSYPNDKVEPTKFRTGLAGITANLKARQVVVDDAFPAELLDVIWLAPGARLVRSVAATAPTERPCPRLPPAGRLAFLQHSAGTTGLQKGVALSHAVVLRQIEHLSTALQLTSGDRIHSWLPLYHDMGLVACFILPMVCHIPVVMQSPTEWVMKPWTMLRLISEYRCTLAWVPNFTLQFLARRIRADERSRYDLSCLRALINCSEPVRAQSMDEMRAAFQSCGLAPRAFQSSYAMAENVFAVTQSRIGNEADPRRIWVDRTTLHEKHIAAVVENSDANGLELVSSGRCLEGSEIRILSEEGSSLPSGTVGEIAIRSDCMFEGYYNRPDLTTAAMRNGWYLSGDLGLLLDDELYVTGRKKDLIIVGGKNIYPQDIEEIAFSHPAVHDGRAVALGVVDPELGTESIVLVAEVNDVRALDQDASICDAIRSAIMSDLGVAVRRIYLRPPHWIVKSTAGKPARSTTREKLLAEEPEIGPTVAN
jgi:fatty-acyl-CoA synthase